MKKVYLVVGFLICFIGLYEGLYFFRYLELNDYLFLIGDDLYAQETCSSRIAYKVDDLLNSDSLTEHSSIVLLKYSESNNVKIKFAADVRVVVLFNEKTLGEIEFDEREKKTTYVVEFENCQNIKENTSDYKNVLYSYGEYIKVSLSDSLNQDIILRQFIECNGKIYPNICLTSAYLLSFENNWLIRDFNKEVLSKYFKNNWLKPRFSFKELQNKDLVNNGASLIIMYEEHEHEKAIAYANLIADLIPQLVPACKP